MDEGRRGRRRDLAVVTAVVAAIAIAGLGGAWLAARRPIETAPLSAKAPEPLSTPAPAQEDEDEPTEAMITLEEIRREIAEEAARSGSRRENGGHQVAPADGPVTLSVKFVGRGEPPDELQVYATPDGGGPEVVLLLTKPATRGRLPAAKTYDLRFWMDGWGSDQQFSGLRVPKDLRLAIEVALPQTASIRVIDAATRSPLPDACAEDADYYLRCRSIPAWGAMSETRGHADGSITFDRSALGGAYWVGAPGHAWTFVDVRAEDRDRPVALEIGGAVDARVSGNADDVALFLRRDAERVAPRRKDEEELAEGQAVHVSAPTEPGRFSVEGLEPGLWHLTLRESAKIGHTGARTLASLDIDVRAGETTRVHLRAQQTVAASRDVLLEVAVPMEWGATPAVRFFGCGEGTRGRGAQAPLPLRRAPGGTWTARLEAIPVGPYLITVEPCGFTAFARVSDDTAPVRVVVPPPVSMRVRVVDGRSGKPIEGAIVQAESQWPDSLLEQTPRITWAPIRCEGTSNAAGNCVLRVPAGTAIVTCRAEDYAEDGGQAVEIRANAGVCKKEFRLLRAGSIRFRFLREGYLAASVRGDFSCSWTGPESENGYYASGGVGTGQHLEEVRPGPYRLRVRIAGIASVLERTVEVKAGEETLVDFDLPAR